MSKYKSNYETESKLWRTDPLTFVISKKKLQFQNFFECNLVSWTCLTSLSFNLGLLWDHEISVKMSLKCYDLSYLKTPNFVGSHAIDVNFVSF